MKLAATILLSACTVCSIPVFANPPAPPNNKPAGAPAKPAPKMSPQEQRFAFLPSAGDRKSAMMMYKLDKHLTEYWMEIIKAKTMITTCDSIWGTKARRNAERTKSEAQKELPRLIEAFDKRYERTEKKISSNIKRINRELKKITSQHPVKNEAIMAKRAKAAEAIKERLLQYDGINLFLRRMESDVHQRPKSIEQVPDRYSQIGLDNSRSPDVNQLLISQYADIIEGSFKIKDLKADISQLEGRKKIAQQKPDAKDAKTKTTKKIHTSAKPQWSERDENLLKKLKLMLPKEGAKLQTAAKHKQDKIEKTIKKLTAKIETEQHKLEKLPESRREKQETKVWDLDKQKLFNEQLRDNLKHISDWKTL